MDAALLAAPVRWSESLPQWMSARRFPFIKRLRRRCPGYRHEPTIDDFWTIFVAELGRVVAKVRVRSTSFEVNLLASV